MGFQKGSNKTRVLEENQKEKAQSFTTKELNPFIENIFHLRQHLIRIESRLFQKVSIVKNTLIFAPRYSNCSARVASLGKHGEIKKARAGSATCKLLRR